MTEEKILDKVPDGWKRRENATNHPRGCAWYYNGQPRWRKGPDGEYHYNPDYKQALVREEVTS